MSNPAPACRAMLSQATARWPYRRTTSDGIVPSAAHTAANPTSDHEMGDAGYNHAVDLSHDPAHGCDCDRISRALAVSRDPRVKYIIFDRRIFSRRDGTWAWRDYGGSNPHTAHMHVSLWDTKAACEDASPWPGVTAAKWYRTTSDVNGYRYWWGVYAERLPKNANALYLGVSLAGKRKLNYQGRVVYVNKTYLEPR